MPDLPDERLLWDSFLQGDNESLERIYRIYFDELYSYGIKWLKEHHLVEDVIQDLFIKLIRTRSNLSSPDSVKFYLFRSFRSVALDRLRKDQRLSVRELPDDRIFPVELTPEHQLISKEEYAVVRNQINKALAEITPRQREALYLRYTEGFSYEQVSDMMELTPKATYKLMARAIEAIKDQMGGALAISVILRVISGNLV